MTPLQELIDRLVRIDPLLENLGTGFIDIHRGNVSEDTALMATLKELVRKHSCESNAIAVVTLYLRTVILSMMTTLADPEMIRKLENRQSL